MWVVGTYPFQYGWIIHQQLKPPNLLPPESFFSQASEREGIGSPNPHHVDCIGRHHLALRVEDHKDRLITEVPFLPDELVHRGLD